MRVCRARQDFSFQEITGYALSFALVGQGLQSTFVSIPAATNPWR